MNDTVTYTFTVAGLDPSSARTITTLLEQQPGVYRAQPSVDLGRIAVDADPAVADPDVLACIITGTGHPASVDRL